MEKDRSPGKQQLGVTSAPSNIEDTNLMSYCRFSTNDYLCDVYAYDDCAGGITIHIAGTRYVFDQPLPEHVHFDAQNLTAWMERHNKVLAMIETATREKISLKHAGESFYGLDAESAAAMMEELRDIGYRFPDGVIEDMREADQE